MNVHVFVEFKLLGKCCQRWVVIFDLTIFRSRASKMHKEERVPELSYSCEVCLKA